MSLKDTLEATNATISATNKLSRTLSTPRFAVLCGLVVYLITMCGICAYWFFQDKQTIATALAENKKLKGEIKALQTKIEDNKAAEDRRYGDLELRLGLYQKATSDSILKVSREANASRAETARVNQNFAKMLQALGAKAYSESSALTFAPGRDRMKIPPELQRPNLDVPQDAETVQKPPCLKYRSVTFFCSENLKLVPQE
jgi:hypothetical protein